MKIKIISAGKWKNCPEKEIFNEYVKRLSWKITLKEVKEIKQLAEKSYNIVLDENGKQFSSSEFAAMIEKLQTESISDVTFLVGGADGHDREVLDKADLKLSFGKMTFPHMLMRPILAEQLYRAYSIISGHPYHRD